MKKFWELQPLGDLCEFVRGPFGGSLKKSIFKPSGFAVYEQQHAIYDQFTEIRYFVDANKFEEMRRFELLPGDLIMSCSGTMGKVAIVPGGIKQGIINQALLKLTPTENISVEFLKYWMGSPGFQDELNRQSQGVAIKNVASVKVLKEIKIPLPPLSEQKRLVAILDQALAGIDAAIANTEQNLANARALFASYLNGVFSRKGDGWVETTLGEAYDVRDGTHDSPKYHAMGYPLITSKNLKRGSLSFDDVKLISEKDYIKINERSVVHKGDVLFAMIGTIGNPTLVEVEPNFAIKNVALFKNSNGQSGAFLKHYLGSGMVISKMMKEAKGTTQKFVGLGYLRGFPINLPPLATQLKIVEELDELSEETQRLETIYQQKLDCLAELKQAILHKAFAGELTGLPEKSREEAVA